MKAAGKAREPPAEPPPAWRKRPRGQVAAPPPARAVRRRVERARAALGPQPPAGPPPRWLRSYDRAPPAGDDFSSESEGSSGAAGAYSEPDEDEARPVRRGLLARWGRAASSAGRAVFVPTGSAAPAPPWVSRAPRPSAKPSARPSATLPWSTPKVLRPTTKQLPRATRPPRDEAVVSPWRQPAEETWLQEESDYDDSWQLWSDVEDWSEAGSEASL